MVYTVLKEGMSFEQLNERLGGLMSSLRSQSSHPSPAWVLTPLAAKLLRLAELPSTPALENQFGRYPFAREMNQQQTLVGFPFVVLLDPATARHERMVYAIDRLTARDSGLYREDEGVRFLCSTSGPKPRFVLEVCAKELDDSSGEYNGLGPHVDLMTHVVEIAQFDTIEALEAWVQDSLPTHFSGRTTHPDERRAVLRFGSYA